MRVEVVKGDITELEIEAIVNPANSQLRMGGGLAGVIKDSGGDEIEKEARKKAPVDVGSAVLTSAGSLPSDHVIHSPTMKDPAQKISTDNVRASIRGVLKCAEENELEEVAIPGLGTGIGGVSPQDAASTMLKELSELESDKLERVVLVGFNQELYEAFKESKEKFFT